MTVNRFEEILRELSVELGTTLHVDKRGACKLRVNETLSLQLECDASQENLWIFSFLCEINPGKFRENVLKDALKANSPFPLYGTLAYAERTNQLALFSSLRLPPLSGKTLFEFLSAFIEKANAWKAGVETGQTASLAKSGSHP